LSERENATLYACRHTCASHLVQGTWAPAWLDRPLRLEEVRDWLGHESVGVTQRYAHLSPESIRGRVRETRKETATRHAVPHLSPAPRARVAKLSKSLEPLTGLEPVTYGLRSRAPSAGSSGEPC